MHLKSIVTTFVLFTAFNVNATAPAYPWIYICQSDKDAIAAEALNLATVNPKNEPHQFIGVSNISAKGKYCIADAEMINAHFCKVIWVKNHWKETLRCLKGSYRE